MNRYFPNYLQLKKFRQDLIEGKYDKTLRVRLNDKLEPSPVSIVTMTCVVKINTKLCLWPLVYWAEVSDKAPGIKNITCRELQFSRGHCDLKRTRKVKNKKKKNRLYNGVPVRVMLTDDRKAVYCNVFRSGEFQLAGVKSAKEAKTVVKIILHSLKCVEAVIKSKNMVMDELKFRQMYFHNRCQLISNCTGKPTESIPIEARKNKYFLPFEKEPQIIGEPTIHLINSKFTFPFEVNREKLNNILIKKFSLDSDYDEEFYPGVKLKYKSSYIFVFGTGEVLITAAKTIRDIVESYHFINSVIQRFPETIQSKVADYFQFIEDLKCSCQSNNK